MFKQVFRGEPEEYTNHFLHSDLAFNWVDKERNTVLQRLGDLFAEKGWNGNYYMNAAGAWNNMAVHDRWMGFLLWHEVEEDEREDRMFSHFVTPLGEEVSCYEDAYGEPEYPPYREHDSRWFIETPKHRRKKIPGRKVPNYAYKPKGKEPFKYFEKKIREVLNWPVRDVLDVNYALRIYEGWTHQAQTYLEAGNYDYTNFIASSVLLTLPYFRSDIPNTKSNSHASRRC